MQLSVHLYIHLYILLYIHLYTLHLYIHLYIHVHIYCIVVVLLQEDDKAAAAAASAPPPGDDDDDDDEDRCQRRHARAHRLKCTAATDSNFVCRLPGLLHDGLRLGIAETARRVHRQAPGARRRQPAWQVVPESGQGGRELTDDAIKLTNWED